MNRRGSRCTLVVLLALLCLAAAACGGYASLSVGVGVGIPAPWGAVTIQTAVPMGYGWN